MHLFYSFLEDGLVLGAQLCPGFHHPLHEEHESYFVAVVDGKYKTLPIKTSCAVPKDKVMECIACLRGLKITAPVRMGQVMLAKVAGTNADFIATRSIPET